MTSVVPEVDSLEDLDFEVPCVMKDGNKGRWSSLLPCTHEVGLMCDECRQTLLDRPREKWACPQCYAIFRAREIKWLGPL